MDSFFKVLEYIFTGIIGAVVGSFLNVCVYRLPRSLSIISPNSYCPNCKAPIRFYDNIPILSYIILHGKCRKCHERISPVYPIVETINAFLYLFFFYKYRLSLTTIAYCVFVSILIIISFIDINFRIIPDRLSISGIILGFLASFIVSNITPIQSILGILIGGGFLFFVAFSYEKIMHREGMGGGDIKLIAMIGAFLGWQGTFFVILFSSFIGSFVGIIFIVLMKKDAKYAISFGPFLSLGAIFYLIFGSSLINWYLSFYRVGL